MSKKSIKNLINIYQDNFYSSSEDNLEQED